MEHKLPELPYAKDALSPNISPETLEYHYGKHHKTYVDNLNKLIPGTEFEKSSLEEIIKNASGVIFNNGAQAWNHTFYWNCLSPKGGGVPTGVLSGAIVRNFGSIEQFKEKFTNAAVTLFGSGWVWLAKKPDGILDIEQASNAGNPFKMGRSRCSRVMSGSMRITSTGGMPGRNMWKHFGI
jgi:superoxide dismutase, Fe-Mn family